MGLLLNVAGYWDGLRALVRHTVREGFVRPEDADLLVTEPTVAALLDRFEAWSAPSGARAWLDPTQI